MTTIYSRKSEPQDPLDAAQQFARGMRHHLVRAKHFAAYRNTAADVFGQVLVFDAFGNQVAGPLDVDAARAWLAKTKLATGTVGRRIDGGGTVRL